RACAARSSSPLSSSTLWSRAGSCDPRRPSRSRFRLHRPLRRPRSLDVAGDLLDQIGFAREGSLLAEALPELDDQAPPVEVTLEIEQECLDLSLLAAVLRVDADRDGGSMAFRLARVDPVCGHEEPWV